MTAPTVESLPLRERAAAKFRAIVESNERQDAERQAKAPDEKKAALARELLNVLAVEDAAIVVTPNGDVRAEVDGLTFSVRDLPYADSCRDRNRLHVLCACSRECGKELWLEVYDLSSLHNALEGEHAHLFDCLVQYDDDGEPTTDRYGNPLPPKPDYEIVEPRRTPEQIARASVDRVTNAAEQLATATRRVQELEDNRALVKARCIKAMIGTPNPLGKEGAVHSASSAKDVVEEHPEYMEHRNAQAEAETERLLAWARYEPAKRVADLEVGLATAAALVAARGE